MQIKKNSSVIINFILITLNENLIYVILRNIALSKVHFNANFFKIKRLLLYKSIHFWILIALCISNIGEDFFFR